MRKLLLTLLLLASPAWAQVGQIPLAVTPSPKTAFFMATNGNDGNPGTIGSPFATLGKCQTAMEASGHTKTCYIRAGLYSSPAATVGGCNNGGSPANIVQLTHAKGDDGETFSYYPPDGIGNVVFDGGGTIPTAFCAYHVKNLTVTGLTFQHFAKPPLYVANWDANDGNGTGDTFSNNTVLNSSPGGSDPCINGAGWIENASILNNFVQNCGGQGIGVSTTQASAVGGMTGLTVSGNVVFNSCTATTDCGGIYFQDYQLPVSTGITNKNNYIYQVNAASIGGNCIYHDDGASNVTSTGNVCVAGGALTSCWLIHGGSNDVLSGNVCDEGSGSEILRYQQTTHTPASFPMTGNSITANDVVCRNAANCGLGYRGLSPVAPAPEVNHGNTYWNFQTASGAVVSTGSGGANGDSGPIAADPGLLCPSGFSTAFGPPGFVLPTMSPQPSWCAGYFVATNGSDANAGTLAAPFATLGKCQTAMRAGSLKTCFLRAGTYTPASVGVCAASGADTTALNLSSPDAGETWSYYPPDGYNSAILNGQNTPGNSNGLAYIVCGDGNAGTVTFNGLWFENAYKALVFGASTLVLTNNVFHGASFASFPNDYGCLLFFNSAGGPTISHNDIENCYDRGIDLEALNSTGINNSTITYNYLQNVCSHNGDCGGMYFTQSATITGATVSYNFIRDVNLTRQQSGSGNNVGFCFYQDAASYPNSGGIPYVGNVCTGSIGYANPTGGGGNGCFFPKESANTSLNSNICDLSSNTSMQIATTAGGSTTGSNNTVSHNIIVANQAQNAGAGYAGSNSNLLTVSNNQYYNYNATPHKGVQTFNGQPQFYPTSYVNAMIARWQASGVAWARVPTLQPDLDPSCTNTLNFGALGSGVGIDALVTALNGAGIEPLLLVGQSAACASSTSVAGWVPPTSPSNWATNFAAKVAAHEGPLGHHNYEIWNEENGVWDWPPAVSASAYKTLLCAVYTAIHGADPSANVILGGLSGTQGTTVLDTTYLTQVYSAGGHGCFDAIADHPYPDNGPTNNVLRGGTNNWDRMYFTSPNLHSIMAANGDGSKTIWVTEVGCATAGSGLSNGNQIEACPDQAHQAQMVTDAFNFTANGFPTLGPIMWWEDHDTAATTCNATTPSSPLDSCAGLWDGNLNPKSAVSSYTNAAGLFGVVSTGAGGTDSNPVSGNPLLHCWQAILAPSSPAYNSPVSFQVQPASWGTPGFWGPPGFAMPQNGTPPSWSPLSGDGVTCPGASEEEFVGPFPSWGCVKSAASGSCGTAAAGFGTAAGDGATDDTAAIQTALNGLGTTYQALWFPVGTYKITHTLSVVGHLHLGAIGADPAATTLLWAGNSASPAATFTGSIATTNSGLPNQLITLTVSGLSGTIVPGQIVGCAGCAPALPQPVLIGAKMSGTTYQLASLDETPITQSSTAMTTADNSMLWLNGTAYSRFDRMTFNGQHNANILVNQSFVGQNYSSSGLYFDTGNEYMDDIFENGGAAINCGSLDYGCSEVSAIRDTFSNNTNQAIAMWNFNALDMWVWYSTFANNAIGIASGAGNWRIFNSIFKNSTVADVFYLNAGIFTMRGDYSVGSNYFWYGSSGNGANLVTLQGNTILDNTSAAACNGNSSHCTVANLGSIFEQDDGPLLLIDNAVRSLGGATTPIAKSYGGLFSLGNTYSVASGAEAFNANGQGFPGHQINNTSGATILASCVSPTWTCLPALPPTPPNLGRAIYETSPTGAGTACSAVTPCSVQTAICEAATGSSAFSGGVCTGTVIPSKAVVHLLPQNYLISTTLAVPANADIQIIGDGGNIGVGSQLSWNGAANGKVLQLAGPSKVTVNEIQINGNSGNATALTITNADQAGSLVYSRETNISTAAPNLLVSGLDSTRVELENFTHQSAPSGASISVVGGTSAAGGNWLGGVTAEYAGSITSNPVSYACSNSGHMLIDSTWLENYVVGAALSLSGKCAVTYAGANVAMTINGSSAATLSGFQGIAALETMTLTSGAGAGNFAINISGNGTGGQVLGLGLSGWSPGTYWNDTTSPADTNEFLNGVAACTGSFPPDINPPCAGNGAYPLTETAANTPFILAALNQQRTTVPVQRLATPAGVTDVGIYRVFISNALKGIDLEH